MNKSLVLDASALIGIERRSPQLQELIHQARARAAAIVIPTVVVAQVIRSGGRQANLRRFLADSYLSFIGLDYPTALEIGALLGDSGSADVVDACVAVCGALLPVLAACAMPSREGHAPVPPEHDVVVPESRPGVSIGYLDAPAFDSRALLPAPPAPGSAAQAYDDDIARRSLALHRGALSRRRSRQG